MHRCLSVLFLMFLLTFSQSTETDLPQLLREAVRAFEAKAETTSVIAIGSFLYADQAIGSSFSRYLEECLSMAFTRSDKFELFEKRKLEEILNTLKLSLSDLVDPDTVVEIGKLKGIQAILAGTYFDGGDTVQVFLKLIDIETGTLQLQQVLSIPKSAIPPSIHVIPENYSGATLVQQQIREVLNADNPNLLVRLWATRGNGATYETGEELVVNFLSNEDCFIKVFHIDATSRVRLVFPNEYCADNAIKKGKVYSIPDGSYPFKWVLEPPCGTEFIKVIASTTQFRDMEEAFSDLGSVSKELLSRGLSVQQRREQVTESMISYTIVE